MTSAGHSWTVSTAVTFDLPTLLQYEGVFLAGNAVDNQVLINYVNNGGNIYLAGGTGWGGSSPAVLGFLVFSAGNYTALDEMRKQREAVVEFTFRFSSALLLRQGTLQRYPQG
jgi:hypothetical protein